MKKPTISVIVETYNRLPFLKRAIKTIRENGIDVEYEIIVVDGGSTDGTLQYLVTQKDIILIVQHNHGTWQSLPVDRKSWGYYTNIGFRASHGKYIVLLSDDCLVIPSSIMNAYHLLENALREGEKVGGAAFYWRNYPRNKEYFVRLTFDQKMIINHGMFVKTALEAVGYVDEDNYFFYHADGDLCLRLWQEGYEIIDSKESYVEHFEHANTTVRSENNIGRAESWKEYKDKWTGIFFDPIKNNLGGRIYRTFTDPTRSVSLFYSTKDFWIYRLRSILKI